MAASSSFYCCSTSDFVLGTRLAPAFLKPAKLVPFIPLVNRRGSSYLMNCFDSPSAFFPASQDLSIDSIPRQFGRDSPSDEVLKNYRNTPQHLYGLPSSQLKMFMNEDSDIRRKLDNMTEASFMASPSILHQAAVSSVSAMKNRTAPMQSASMFFNRRRKNRHKPAPDLPSSLLRARICYLGMPVFPAVSELIIAQLMYLDSVDSSKPIHFYINSTGTLDDNRQLVALENDAYAIADAMALCRAPIYTINCGVADGQAAMLLSLGTKGKRATQPNATVQLHLPKAENLSGSASDMWIQAKEVDVNTEYYVELLGKGTCKPKEEILDFIAQPKHFLAQDAIDYGIVDVILDKMPSYEKHVPKRVRVKTKGNKTVANGAVPRPPLNGVGVRPPAKVRAVRSPSFVRLARAAGRKNGLDDEKR